MKVRRVLMDVGPTALSGSCAEPEGEPRGLVVCLHGGRARAAYFDSPLDEGSSLIRLAAALGWRAVTLDRPGYGASADFARSRPRAADQVDLLASATAQLRPAGAPVLLVGHSLGGIVAVHLAAREAVPGLVALALGGVPLRYTDAQLTRLAAVDAKGTHISRAPGPMPSPDDWFGPAGSWDPRLLDHRQDLVTRTPSAEFLDARDCPVLLPPLLLADVRVPRLRNGQLDVVSDSRGEHSVREQSGPPPLAGVVHEPRGQAVSHWSNWMMLRSGSKTIAVATS